MLQVKTGTARTETYARCRAVAPEAFAEDHLQNLVASDDLRFANHVTEELLVFKTGVNMPRSRGDREEVFGGKGRRGAALSWVPTCWSRRWPTATSAPSRRTLPSGRPSRAVPRQACPRLQAPKGGEVCT